MSFFTDSAENPNKWELKLDINTIRRVDIATKFRLDQAVLISPDGGIDDSGLRQLSCDVLLLVDVLWTMIEPQAERKGVSAEAFAAGLGGDAIGAACEALLEAIIDFFPSAQRRIVLKLLEVTRLCAEKTKKNFDELCDAPAFVEQAAEALASRFASSLTRLAGSAESTPESTASGN